VQPQMAVYAGVIVLGELGDGTQLGQTIPTLSFLQSFVDRWIATRPQGSTLPAICCSRSGIPGFSRGVHLIPVLATVRLPPASSIVGTGLIAPDAQAATLRSDSH